MGSTWESYLGWTIDEKATLENVLLSTIEENVATKKEQSTIVMLGCNHGNISRIVANQLTRYKPRIIAIDNCVEALRKGIVKEETIIHREKISYQYGDARKIGFHPQYQNIADLVTLNFLPSNVPKRDQTILFKSAVNILKAKGKLVFVDPDPNTIYDAINKDMTTPQSDSKDTFRVICDQFRNPLQNVQAINENSIIKIYLLRKDGNIIIENDYRPIELYLQTIHSVGLKIDFMQRLKLAKNKSENENYFCCLCSKK
jgi:SAM-dependent methyltransferase